MDMMTQAERRRFERAETVHLLIWRCCQLLSDAEIPHLQKSPRQLFALAFDNLSAADVLEIAAEPADAHKIDKAGRFESGPDAAGRLLFNELSDKGADDSMIASIINKFKLSERAGELVSSAFRILTGPGGLLQRVAYDVVVAWVLKGMGPQLPSLAANAGASQSAIKALTP